MRIRFTNICVVLVAVAAGINVYVAQKRQQTEEQLLSLANMDAGAVDSGSESNQSSSGFSIPGRCDYDYVPVVVSVSRTTTFSSGGTIEAGAVSPIGIVGRGSGTQTRTESTTENYTVTKYETHCYHNNFRLCMVD